MKQLYLIIFFISIMALSGCIGSDDVSTVVSNGTGTIINNFTNITINNITNTTNISGVNLSQGTGIILNPNPIISNGSISINTANCNPANEASVFNGTGFECKNVADSDPYILLSSEPNLNVNSSNYWNFVSLQNISINHTLGASVSNLEQAYNMMWSTGVIQGGDANFSNYNSTGINVTISSGTAIVHDINNDTGNLLAVNFSNTTLFIPYLTNYWLYVDYNSITNTASIKSTLNFGDISGHSQVTLYKIYIEEAGETQIIDARGQNIDTELKLRRFLYNVFLYAHASNGNIVGTPSGLNLTVTSGLYYYGLNPIIVPAFDTTLPIVAPNENDSHHFEYYYYNTSAPMNWTDGDNTQRIDSVNYNPTSGLTAMLPNKYKADYVYYEMSNDSAPGTVPAHLAIVYSPAEYATLAAAIASAPPTNLPPSLLNEGILIGRVIVQNGVTTINQVDSVYTQQFTSSVATNHNNLAGLQGCGTLNDCYHLSASLYSNVVTYLTDFVTSVNTIVSTNILQLQANDSYFNGSTFPNSTNFRNDSLQSQITSLSAPSNNHTQKTITDNYTITTSDETIFINANNSINITLPTAVNNRNIYNIKSISNLVNNLYLQTVGGIGSTSSFDANVEVTKIIANSSGYVSTILMMNLSTAAGNVRMAIYNDSSGSPNKLLNESTSQIAISGVNNFTIPATYLTNNTVYWLAVQSDNSGAKMNYISTGGTRCYALYSYNPFPATFPAPTCDTSRIYSGIYFGITQQIYVNPSNNQTIENAQTIRILNSTAIVLQGDNSNWWII